MRLHRISQDFMVCHGMSKHKIHERWGTQQDFNTFFKPWISHPKYEDSQHWEHEYLEGGRTVVRRYDIFPNRIPLDFQQAATTAARRLWLGAIPGGFFWDGPNRKPEKKSFGNIFLRAILRKFYETISGIHFWMVGFSWTIAIAIASHWNLWI